MSQQTALGDLKLEIVIITAPLSLQQKVEKLLIEMISKNVYEPQTTFWNSWRLRDGNRLMS